MNNKLKSNDTDRLFEAMMTLKTTEEFYDFFEDLCTVAEIKAMSQRFAVALMLQDKSVYSDIVEKTGASTATISRINRCLNYGSDGYRTAIERLKK